MRKEHISISSEVYSHVNTDVPLEEIFAQITDKQLIEELRKRQSISADDLVDPEWLAWKRDEFIDHHRHGNRDKAYQAAEALIREISGKVF